jgi:hypothetical protein
MPELIRKSTPEEQELDRKRVEYASLQSELIDRETELATLAAELHAFEIRYLEEVGPRMAWLDELVAERIAYEARRTPTDQEKQEEARQAREQAEETARANRSAHQEAESARKETVSEDLKKLFRELCRKFHPDLTTDEAEKRRRTGLMQEINAAFAAGDEDRLREILAGAAGDDSLGDGVVAELIRIIRKIAAIRDRIEKVASEIENLENGDLAQLRQQIEEAEDEGEDPFETIRANLDAQIIEAVEGWYQSKRGF